MSSGPPGDAPPSVAAREPSALALGASLVVLFLGGAAIGVTLSNTFAPDSFIAEVVSVVALPVAFVLGMQVWMGVALFRAIVVFIGSRRRPRSRALSPRAPLPGSVVFLPISSVAGAIAGMLVGLLSTAYSGWLAWLVYWTVGTVHGFTAWRLARAGYLMPPEEM